MKPSLLVPGTSISLVETASPQSFMRVGRSVSWTSVLILTFVFIQIEGYVIGVRNKGFQTREISSLLLSSSSLNQPRMESDEDNPLLIVCRLDKIGLDHSAKTRLVLASQSPRRREILDMMMLKGKYTVKIPPLDESKVQRELAEDGVCPEVYTRKLAEAKAFALAEHDLAHNSTDEAKVPTFYLGSDTVVEIDDKILEKPKDPEEARQMLTLMSGRQHHVHTGVALYRLLENDISLISSFTDTATVTFCKLSSETIDAYVATGEPLDKAGSYGIQGVGGQLVQSIVGDFFTVMGLPMHRTSIVLARAIDQELG